MSNFSFETDIDLAEGSKNYLSEAGIYDNVDLVNIEFKQISEKVSGMQLVFTFQTDDNRIFQHVEFEPVPAELKKLAKSWNPKATAKEVEQTAVNMWKSQMARISHILKAFMPVDKVNIKGKDWNSLCNNIVSETGQIYTGQKFRIKVILDKKDRCTFPKAVKAPGFVVNMDSNITLHFDPKEKTQKTPVMDAEDLGMEMEETENLDSSPGGAVEDPEPKTGPSPAIDTREAAFEAEKEESVEEAPFDEESDALDFLNN